MYASLKNYLILFAGVFALSTSAIWVKIAQAPSAVIALYRLLFAAIVLLPFLLLNKERVAEVKTMTRRRIGQVLAAGFFLALHYVAQNVNKLAFFHHCAERTFAHTVSAENAFIIVYALFAVLVFADCTDRASFFARHRNLDDCVVRAVLHT